MTHHQDSTPKKHWTHSLRLYAVVTFVTVMVWVVAEGQTLRRQSTEMTIGFTSSQQFSLQIQSADWTGRVDVTFEGSAASVDSIQAMLREPVTVSAGVAGVPTDDGVHTIDLRAMLRAHPALRESAIAIARVEPRTVQVRVTALERIEQPVEVVLPEGVDATSVSVVPASVALVAPQGMLSGVGPVRVVVDASSLAGLPQGRPVTLTEQRVVVGGSPPEGLVLDPVSVQVTLELRTRTEQIVLPSVPVLVQMPPIELNRWTVEIPESERVVRNVTLSGPASVIEAYRRGERELVAVIRLGFEELETQISSKRAEFPGLPSGVRVEVADPMVDLRIVPRPAAVVPPPGGGD